MSGPVFPGLVSSYEPLGTAKIWALVPSSWGYRLGYCTGVQCGTLESPLTSAPFQAQDCLRLVDFS
jgi:hypothetical protein